MSPVTYIFLTTLLTSLV